MNLLKPFMFWIVLGAILFCEIVWWALSVPDIDMVGNKASAQRMQGTLKEEFKHLTELDRRAKNNSPLGVFDAEKADDIRRLTDDYLVTPAWKEVLDPHVLGYDKQLKAIKERLAARSKHLNDPIAASTDKFGWYTAYQNASEEQLKKLNAVGALALKATAGSPSTAAPRTQLGGGTGAGPGSGTGAPGGVQPATNTNTNTTRGTNDSAPPDFANDSVVRAQGGFFTKGADLPDAGEYPVLTRQFRTMERLISIITETSATNTTNPVSGVLEAPTAGHAAIVSVTWDNSETAIGGETGSYAEGWRLTLVLQGSTSAVLATTAAIEHPHGDSVPLMVVTGGELTRKTQFIPGERKDVGSELINARVDILVLDFTNAPAGVKPSSTPAAPKPGGRMPGPGGMPAGGMPPSGMPPGMTGKPPSNFQSGQLPGGQPPQPATSHTTATEEGGN